MFANTEKTGASRHHTHRNLQDVDALEEMKHMWQLGPAVANENDACAWQFTEFRCDACDNSLGLGCVQDRNPFRRMLNFQ